MNWMMKPMQSRLDPSLLPPEELDRLAEMVFEEERPALIGREGVRIDLPDPIFHLLVRTVRAMQEGKCVFLLPEDETFTTQAAASYLGMSRQFLVNLLDQGAIPHHRVGTHRKVYFKDLLAYQKQRDQQRRKDLDQLFEEVEAVGVYDAQPPEDEG